MATPDDIPAMECTPATSSGTRGRPPADDSTAPPSLGRKFKQFRKPLLVLSTLSCLAAVLSSQPGEGLRLSALTAESLDRRRHLGAALRKNGESKKELLEKYRNYREEAATKTQRIKRSIEKEHGAIAAEHKLTTGFEKLKLEEAEVNFRMPKRPKNNAKISWGETALPAEESFESTEEENPWIKTTRIWRSSGSRKKQKLVVIGGLPRSGSTLLEVFFSRFEEFVSFLKFPPSHQNTMEGLELGHWPSELLDYGGSGQFYGKMCGADEDGKLAKKTLHRTGRQPDLVHKTRLASYDAWQSWNFSKPVLVEKDPPNLLRMQFFEKVFGETHDVFPIFTLKHPLEIGSAYDCDPHSSARLEISNHWLTCHQPWLKDLTRLRNYLVVPYEAWFLNLTEVVTSIARYLNLPIPRDQGRRLVLWNPSKHFKLDRIAYAPCYRGFSEKFEHLHKDLARLEKDYVKYGYTLSNSATFTPPKAFVLCKLDGKPCSEL